MRVLLLLESPPVFMRIVPVTSVRRSLLVRLAKVMCHFNALMRSILSPRVGSNGRNMPTKLSSAHS